ncbi:MAG: hypothetical protein N0E44_18210 [Candidatus Thiodiazotropha lotti]|nr:hypothetical protein [Candidatus Thiodiazotropha lotti]MCW4221818.1 hypothetical protein [Candidatus Thiodiazotropha lotti]
MARSCPTAIVDEAIRQAAIEFCDFTYTWRLELDAKRVRAGVSDYDIDAPKCGRLAHMLYVSHNGIEVAKATERTLDDTVEGWRTAEAQVAANYFMPDKQTIRLALTPTLTASKTLKMVAAFKPTVDASVLANNLYDDHLEAITHGALARLYEMDGQPWANPQGAINKRALFETAKKKEKAERLNDYTRESTLTVRGTNYGKL